MTLSEGIIIVMVSQVPLVIYTIINGLRRHKPEIKKLDAESQASLSDAVEGAGKTLVDAWRRIDELDEWKEKAEKQITDLKDELRKYQKAFARAVHYIRTRMPDQEIPNFFETGPVGKQNK